MRARTYSAIFTGEDRAKLRQLLRQGETFASAAKIVGCSTKFIQRLLDADGGFQDRSRARSPLRLSQSEREEISCGLRAGLSCRRIAESLKRSPSTVSRDVRLGGGRTHDRAVITQERARKRRRRPKPEKLSVNPRLRQQVEQRLQRCWSLQQICRSLRQDV